MIQYNSVISELAINTLVCRKHAYRGQHDVREDGDPMVPAGLPRRRGQKSRWIHDAGG